MPHRELTFDVVVMGGGPAGIGATVGAARAGARVAVVERHDVLGGMGTAALVNNFCPAHKDGMRLIIGGVFGQLRQRLIDRRAIYPEFVMEPYDPRAFAEEAHGLCTDSGATAFLGCGLEHLSFNSDGARTRILLNNGSELFTRTVVDATGDAFIATAADVPCSFGNGRGNVMPLTYCFKMGPVEIDAVARGPLSGCVQTDPLTGERAIFMSLGDDPPLRDWMREAKRAGELTIPRTGLPAVLSVPGQPRFVTVNFGRVTCANPANPVALARATAEGKRQVVEAIAFFRKYFPGFEKVELVELARQIGVRESRQIRGRYTLTRDDVVNCRQFDDVIAQCWYPIDIHHPDGEGTTMVWLQKGTHYDIPWRCLVPIDGPPNLVVGGRCISATPEAMSSFRVSPSVMAIGEAAGTGAALAARRGCPIRDVPYSELRAALLKNGAILS